ncbi:ABC transporter permease [Vibrio sinus]|uniref:ABC transporter permease n=1 Tax=Vibrio sinus TaxID=2946865 RepID=UPI0032B4631E
MFRVSYLIVVVVCVLPLLPGLLGVIVASLGYIPPLGLHHFSLTGFSQVMQWKGVERSIGLTVATSIASTYLAVLFCFAILQSLFHRPIWKKIETLISPLLAMPHVAFAIGFAFLFSPSGLFFRLLHQLFGVKLVDSYYFSLVQDPYAIGLTLVLALKETPFLLLMSLPIIQQLNIDKLSQVSTSLGYSPKQFWWKVILPQWLPRLRFPLFAVLAYGVSVVDISVIMGPNRPSTFSVLIWQWFNEADLSLMPRAAAGATIIFALTLAMMGLTILIEKVISTSYKSWQFSGRYGLRLPGKSILSTLMLLSIVLFPIMLIWSVAQRWRFPDLLPMHYSLRFWHEEWNNVWPSLSNSVSLAIISATCALILAIIAQEYRLRYKLRIPSYVIVLPILIPQLSVLFGIQIGTLFIASDQFYAWVLWSHTFYAFPYLYLALDGPWKSYDNHYTHTGLSLGKSPIQVFTQVKFPILRTSIFYAWAVGASVSLAQYLPTLMLGSGRIVTITTQAVTLTSGFDRRVTAIFALWQALLPFIFFTIVILLGKAKRPSLTKSSKEFHRHDAIHRKPNRKHSVR